MGLSSRSLDGSLRNNNGNDVSGKTPDDVLPLHQANSRPEKAPPNNNNKLSNEMLGGNSEFFRLDVLLALLGFIGLPCLFRNGMPGSTLIQLIQSFFNTWDALLRMGSYAVLSLTLLVAVVLVHLSSRSPAIKKKEPIDISPVRKCWNLIGTPHRLSVLVVALLIYLSSFTSIKQLVDPGWKWNPFLWFTYKVYWPEGLSDAMKGLCVDFALGSSDQDPLCLSEPSWEILSAGALSSHNSEDVETVLAGIAFAQKDSSGLVVNVLARDVADQIDALHLNMDGLKPFFPKLSVVIFENDSTDGSRERFKEWAAMPNKGYEVDLMTCPEAEDCKTGKEHRYDGEKELDFFKTPAIGDMHKFRQRMLDYIASNPVYYNYSHMLQIDLDLGVSLSPLGLMHTLGKEPYKAVASSCRQPWPGGLGSLVPMYDFNAFQALPIPEDERLDFLHKKLCALMPPDDKWQFNCVGASSARLLQILQLDRDNRGGDLYKVASAYNGATIYPLKLIRENHPKYDAGDNGMRCEHVGFNLSIDQFMYINPKWDMHMSPSMPGGPKGERALKYVNRYSSIPQVAIPMALQTAIPMIIFVFSVMTLSVLLVEKVYFYALGRRSLVGKSHKTS